MEVGGTDLVLGMDWLASLGDVRANFRNLVLSWGKKGEKKMMKGDPSLCKTQVSWKALLKALHNEGEGYVLSYQPDREQGIPETVVDPLEVVLKEFEGLFREPSDLPPQRGRDHAIILKEGSNIPNIRPYRYPYYQKSEIERYMREMLPAGIIRTSNRPYSSPVILVKKKYGGWRFCVDYRALNKLTLPDKFPIPVIDELLDGLGGAKVFSKLDLKSGYHRIRMNIYVN